MSPSYDPMRHFGRKIQSAVTRDPAFEAMLTGDRQIPNTWGNLASQLVEEGLVEPSAEAATDLLGIETEQLSDTRLLFTEPYAVEEFERQFTTRHAEIYKEQKIPAAQAFITYLRSAYKQYEVGPEESEIENLGSQIDELRNEPERSQEEYEVKCAKIGKLSMKRVALESGLAYPLAEFVKTVLDYEAEDGFTVADRASALKDVMHDVEKCITFPERVEVAEVVLGRSIIADYIFWLDHSLTRRAYSHANRQWGRIEHLFIAPLPEEHPFFSGTEK